MKSKTNKLLFIGIIVLVCLTVGYFLYSEIEEIKYTSQKEKACIESGGKVIYITCYCKTKDFPNTCSIGYCSCHPWESGYKIKICDCGPDKCFDGKKCVNRSITQPQKVHEDDYKIFLSSREFVPSPGISPSTEAKITTSPLERVHVLIQFYHVPNAAEREKLENASVKLLTYIPNNAWFASISKDSPAKILQFPFVRWIGEILPEDKISPIIRENKIPPEAINPDGTVNLTIMFFKDVSLDDAAQVISKHGGKVKGRSLITNDLVVIVPMEKISAIANEDFVQWIDTVPGPPKRENNR